MEGIPCPKCGRNSELLSTTNEWKYDCREHGRFNILNMFATGDPAYIAQRKAEWQGDTDVCPSCGSKDCELWALHRCPDCQGEFTSEVLPTFDTIEKLKTDLEECRRALFVEMENYAKLQTTLTQLWHIADKCPHCCYSPEVEAAWQALSKPERKPKALIEQLEGVPTTEPPLAKAQREFAESETRLISAIEYAELAALRREVDELRRDVDAHRAKVNNARTALRFVIDELRAQSGL